MLLAGTNDTVRALNHAVRSQLIAAGLLDEQPIARFAGRDFTAGDRVVLRRNSYRETTTTRCRSSGTERPIRNDHRRIHQPPRHRTRPQTASRCASTKPTYAPGDVDHGYALTTHRAQGGTWDHAIAVGTDGLYREAAYVQLSRGTTTNP